MTIGWWVRAIGKRAKRAVIASRRTRTQRAARPDPSPRKKRVAQDDSRVVGERDREASQTRDYCVAKCATQRAARPDPSLREGRLFRMTIGWWVRAIGKRAKRAVIASQRTRRNARLAQIPRSAKSALLRMTSKSGGRSVRNRPTTQNRLLAACAVGTFIMISFPNSVYGGQ
jgi:hypothetical protein